MVLEQKEMDVIKELQTQEKSCVEKYRRYKEQACDMELKNLFGKIEKLEQKHYDTLGKVLEGEVPECNCNDDDGKNYEPPVTYAQADNSELQTVSELKRWFHQSTIQKYSALQMPHSENLWQIYR